MCKIVILTDNNESKSVEWLVENHLKVLLQFMSEALTAVNKRKSEIFEAKKQVLLKAIDNAKEERAKHMAIISNYDDDIASTEKQLANLQ